MDAIRIYGWLLRSTFIIPPLVLAFCWFRIVKSKADGTAIALSGAVTISLTWWLAGVSHQQFFGPDETVLRHSIIYGNLVATLIVTVVFLIRRGTRTLSSSSLVVAGAWTIGALIDSIRL
jgi:hypothetical protein